MIKINIEVVKDNGEIEGSFTISTELNRGYKTALLEVVEVFARSEAGGVNGKVETFRRVLKDASETAENCDTEDLTNLLRKDYADGSEFDKCYYNW